MAEPLEPTSSMRAAYIQEYNEPYALGKKSVPEISNTDLLVRVCAAGFCHSDLQALQGQFKKPSPLGLTPSHEAAGIIVKVGSGYNGPLVIGDRVGLLNFKNACGSCVGCNLIQKRSGKLDARFCENRDTAGFLHDGAFADYIVADPQSTIKLPDTLSFEQAAPLMCAGATVWGSLEKATESLEKGATVAVVGIGGLGFLGLQFAKALGFRTIAVDSRSAGRQLATEMDNLDLCPDLVVDSGSSDDIFSFTQGEGVAAAIVCTDSIEANRWTLGILRIGGVMGVLGLPSKPWQFDGELLVFKELTIKGSYVASLEATSRMLDEVGRSCIRSQVTVISFDQIPDIVSLYEDKAFKGRIVVDLEKE